MSLKLLTAILLSAGIVAPGLVFALAAPAARAAAPAAAQKVASVEGITEYRLGNGMRVLLFPDASKPTLTTNIVYLVGSRHENYGETGMAHLLEHLLWAVLPLPLKDDAADYPALLMANHMLGGGALRSRLADRIRQKEGLSYAVGSQLSAPARDPAGAWIAYAISAPQNSPKVEAALREEIALALKSGFTGAELAEAKKGWRQAEEVARTDDGALAQRLGHYLTLERSMAYDQALEAKIAALTVAQVNQALRRHIKPDQLSIVSAGDFAKDVPAPRP